MKNMAEIQPDLVWPRAKAGALTTKVGPWTPAAHLYNYKTSYEIGFPRISPKKFFAEPYPPAKCEEPHPCDREVIIAGYATTYNKAYEYKCKAQDPIGKADKPPARYFKYMTTVKEKCNRLPRKIDWISEFKAKYPPHFDPNTHGELVDNSSAFFCPVKGLTRDDVAKIDLSEGGYGKHLDIYVSQGHMDYIYHKPAKVHQYKEGGIYVQPAFEPPKPQLRSLGEDNAMFAYSKTSPLEISCSETRANFVKPNPMVEPIGDYFMPIIKQTTGEVMAVPGMYHTEYNHIGHDCKRRPLPLKQLRIFNYREKLLI